MPNPRMPELGERSETAALYTQAEVDALIANLQAMNLEEGGAYMKVMSEIPFYKLDKLFNGAPN